MTEEIPERPKSAYGFDQDSDAAACAACGFVPTGALVDGTPLCGYCAQQRQEVPA